MAMQPKHARQVLMKLLDLCGIPTPADAKVLKGTTGDFLRADIGEAAGDVLFVPLIGKRNDDEVYKEMKRRRL